MISGLLVLPSCLTTEPFECDDNQDCASGGIGATCETAGFCSFTDSECESGRRFGEFADEEFANECVVADSPCFDSPVRVLFENAATRYRSVSVNGNATLMIAEDMNGDHFQIGGSVGSWTAAPMPISIANTVAPTLSTDGLRVYSVRSSDIFVGTRTSTAEAFQAGLALGSGVNDSTDQFAPSIGVDDSLTFLSRPSSAAPAQIRIAARVGGQFPSSVAVTVEFSGSIIKATLVGDRLVFSGSLSGGTGRDLFVATRVRDQSFSTPTLLGALSGNRNDDAVEPFGSNGIIWVSNRTDGPGVYRSTFCD